MLRRTSKIIIAVVLLICLVCPIMELFDQWDNTVQTGNDTEYALVIVGLCIGVAYAFERFLVTSPVVKSMSESMRHFLAATTLVVSGGGPYFIIATSLSPPTLSLRI
jgi:hypothetical protein